MPIVKKKPGKPGRPLRNFVATTFEQLCFVQCTVDEIELILKTDQRIIDGWCKRHYKIDFATAYKRFSSGGKRSLRRTQFKMAAKNASMAIWLGKQWLGQKDDPTKYADDALETFTQLMKAAATGKLKQLLQQDDQAITIEHKGDKP